MKLLALALVLVVLSGLAGVARASVDHRGSTDSDARARARAAVCSVFTGWRCAPAMRVVRCETGGTYNPRSLGAAGERGLFQVHPVHFGWLDERRLFERVYNARIAFRLSRGGTNWRPWSCKP